MLTVIPAIDIKDGRCVRLRQGKMDDAKVYSEDPVEMARKWAAEGARYLHVVDLDGAAQGKPVHKETIAKIAAAVSIPVEAGGGLRTEDDIKAALDCGISRAIVGTLAFAETAALKKLARKFGARLAVGIDARNGMVQIHGWAETTTARALDLARQADTMRVKTLICTDTAADGMMRGTNVTAIGEICENVRCDVIASGGVTSSEDIRALRALNRRNLIGAIVGKALYEGAVTLRELSAAAEES